MRTAILFISSAISNHNKSFRRSVFLIALIKVGCDPSISLMQFVFLCCILWPPPHVSKQCLFCQQAHSVIVIWKELSIETLSQLCTYNVWTILAKTCPSLYYVLGVCIAGFFFYRTVSISPKPSRKWRTLDIGSYLQFFCFSLKSSNLDAQSKFHWYTWGIWTWCVT